MFDKDCMLVEREAHADERGMLFELLRFKDEQVPAEGYIYTFSIAPGKRRGDHYHERKHEWFACVAGEVTVLVEEKDGTKHRFTLRGDAPAILYNAPHTAHTLLNETDAPAQVVCYGSKPFDPADPDTFPKVLS